MGRRCLFALVAVALTGCATMRNTPAQDTMWAAYDQCRAEGRVPPNVQLLRVDPDGRPYYQTYTSSYGGADFERCINEKTSRLAPR